MLKVDKESLEQRLQCPVADISKHVWTLLRGLGDVDEECMLEVHLRKTEYGLLLQQVTKSVEKHEDIVVRILSALDDLSHWSSARVKELAAGYKAFMELNANITEGTHFYNDITGLLFKLDKKISDFVFARRKEKEYLLK